MAPQYCQPDHAGIGLMEPLEQMSLADWRRQGMVSLIGDWSQNVSTR